MARNLRYYLSILLIPIVFGACKRRDSREAQRDLERGSWKITLYQDNGRDETAHFSDYTFEFFKDGKVSVSGSTGSVTGNWSTAYHEGHNKFFLDFGSNNVFNGLNDDWTIKSETNTELELEDVSGGNGGTDLLTLHRL